MDARRGGRRTGEQEKKKSDMKTFAAHLRQALCHRGASKKVSLSLQYHFESTNTMDVSLATCTKRLGLH
mgnify:CR=1 FL=1